MKTSAPKKKVSMAVQYPFAVSVTLNEEQYEWVRAEAFKRHLKMGPFVRDLIDQASKRTKK